MFPDASGMKTIKIHLRAMGFTVVASMAFWGASSQPPMTLFFFFFPENEVPSPSRNWPWPVLVPPSPLLPSHSCRLAYALPTRVSLLELATGIQRSPVGAGDRPEVIVQLGAVGRPRLPG